MILQRVANLDLRLLSSNEIEVSLAGQTTHCAAVGLTILDLFSQPTAVNDALNKLKVRGRQEWIELSTLIHNFYKAGILQDPQKRAPAFHAGFAKAAIHLAMLGDRVRTASFLHGIQETVKPGDVVVDIGTGTGILAIAAARAGARQVFAIEASEMAEVATAIIAANGYADQITVLRGWSTQLELPERADVLVSEVIGNDPLDEKVLELTADAQRRLLKPAARLVPSQVKLFGLLVAIPQEQLLKYTLLPETRQQWRAWYAVDFAALAKAHAPTRPLFYTKPQETREWPVFSDPILFADIDFSAQQPLVINQTVTVPVTAAGAVNGLLLFFETKLGTTATLSTHPEQADASNHWRSPVWFFDATHPAQAGEQWRIRYQYGVSGRFSTVELLGNLT